MRDPRLNKIIEFFGFSTEVPNPDWDGVVARQHCPFIDKRCYKVRKSDPATAIGTCSVLYGKGQSPVVICPSRLLEKKKIFVDCLHLLTTHEPGNELHVVQEVSVPGGTVDFFLVSANRNKVRDFVGIELQTLDTTGTVWPERQRLLRSLGLPRAGDQAESAKAFGMNWKMTAKTILVQLHHKVQTFEHVGKRLVLVIQDELLDYMSREFRFSHLRKSPALGDPMHLHSYRLAHQGDCTYGLELDTRMSTDSAGIAACLDLQAEARVELDQIVESLESKLSLQTRFTPF